jgi:hypothetical protein
MSEALTATTIKVLVTFPLGKKGPYHADDARDTLVGAVRTAAMAYFEVADDARYRYYLTRDGNNVDENLSLGQVAGHTHDVKFGLRKELVQG